MLDTIGNRIAKIIEAKGIKKVQFASRINVDQSYISQLTSGKKTPSDRTVADICREFDVSEEWLRTGRGEMFVPKSRNEELFEFAAEAAENPESVKGQFLAVMARLTDEQWEVLAEIAQKLAEEIKKTGPE